MEVKIGVQNANRELTVDVDGSADDIAAAVEDAVSRDDGVLTLRDARGRRVLVPADRLAYVEISTTPTGTVGFRS